MNCSRVRQELLEHFRFPEELGPRSGPHLAHLESCADCRKDVGLDLELVEQLRRALRERVEGSAPSTANWELIRRRTVDLPSQQWTIRMLRWSGMLPAAVGGIMMLAIATTSGTGLLHGTHSPVLTASAEQALPPVQPTGSVDPAWSSKVRGLQAVLELSDGPQVEQPPGETARDEMPPIPGRMQ
jgi:anti-sigma factor RsiW